MALNELSNGSPDGTRMGQDSSDKISFYGATAVDRPAVASAVTQPTTASLVTAGIGYGFATTTQGTAIVDMVRGFKTDLEELGLIG